MRWILKIKEISFKNVINGNKSWIALLKAIYSASVILIVISVCRLLHHNNVHPPYIYYAPCTLNGILYIIITQLISSTIKIGINVTSNSLFFVGVDKWRVTSDKYMYVNVISKYFSISLAAHLCINGGLLQNHAHWCTAIKSSGHIKTWRQLKILTADK